MFIQSLINEREHQIKTIDDLLAAIPENLLNCENCVLMHQSGSAQSASYQSPRVILHSAGDAAFTMAFSGDPTDKKDAAWHSLMSVLMLQSKWTINLAKIYNRPISTFKSRHRLREN